MHDTPLFVIYLRFGWKCVRIIAVQFFVCEPISDPKLPHAIFDAGCDNEQLSSSRHMRHCEIIDQSETLRLNQIIKCALQMLSLEIWSRSFYTLPIGAAVLLKYAVGLKTKIDFDV
jgi:hypothetical protein